MHTPLAHFHLLLFGCTLLIWHKAQPGWHDLALTESDSVAGRGCTKGNGKWRLQPRPSSSSSSSSIHNAATVPWKKICLLIGRARRALPLRHFGCTKVESKPGQASSQLYIRHIHVCTREVSHRCMYADTYEYVPYTRLLSLLWRMRERYAIASYGRAIIMTASWKSNSIQISITLIELRT